MSENRQQNRVQTLATEEEGGNGLRFFACLVAIVALLSLFAYRAATTDPLWDAERAAPAAAVN